MSKRSNLGLYVAKLFKDVCEVLLLFIDFFSGVRLCSTVILAANKRPKVLCSIFFFWPVKKSLIAVCFRIATIIVLPIIYL